MGKIIALSNQKGGVGKTTTAISLAAALGAKGKNVLLVDLDPQGNASSGLGVNKKSVHISSYDLLIMPQMKAQAAVVETQFKNLSIIPTTIALAGAELELVSIKEHREERLKQALSSLKDLYDYILIDCPPSLGLLTLNAWVAADGVIIPVQCEFFALEGLTQLTSHIERVRRLYNKSLRTVGILVTMFDGRLNLSKQVVKELKTFHGAKLFPTPIPRSVRLSEASGFGQPIYYFDRWASSSTAYMKVADELIERI